MTVAMIRPIAITPGRYSSRGDPERPEILREIPRVVSDGCFCRAIMGVATISGRRGSSNRAYRDDFPGTLLLHHRCGGIARINGPEQVHLRHELQERRIKGAGIGVHRP